MDAKVRLNSAYQEFCSLGRSYHIECVNITWLLIADDFILHALVV